MTQDEIIELARQAGFHEYSFESQTEQFNRFAKLVADNQQRTWVGLTDEEIADCAEKMEASDPTDSFWREFFRGIEAKLKEKNI
jgi:hypothetical protein